MRRTLILLVIVCGAALLLGSQPIRHVDAEPSGGSSNSTPVDVMNFPVDESGALLVAGSVANRVMDLLDDPTTLDNDSGLVWLSDEIDTATFHKVAFEVSVDGIGFANAVCHFDWSLLEESPFLADDTLNEGGQPLRVSLDDDSQQATYRTLLRSVKGLKGRVRCSVPEFHWVTITDVRVLLRRE